MSSAPKEEPAKPGNFLRAAIERDLESGTYAGRRFAGTPGDAAHQAGDLRHPNLGRVCPIHTQDLGDVSHPAWYVLARHPINQHFPTGAR